MKTWLKEYVPVIGALAGVVIALVAILQLAIVGPMNRGFDDLRAEMNQRFDDMNRSMDQRFDQQDKYMNTRFDAVDQRFEAVDGRLDQLTSEVSELRALVVDIGERVSRNEGRIDLLTEQLQATPIPSP